MRTSLARSAAGWFLICFVLRASSAQAVEQRLVVLPLDVTQTGGKMSEQGRALIEGKALGAVPGSFKVGVCRKKLEVKGKGGLGYSTELKLEERKIAAVRAVLAQHGRADREPRLDAVGPAVGEGRVEPKSGLKFIGIPAGTFQFQGKQTVAVKAFELGETATTVDAYARCVKAGVCSKPNTGGACNWGTDRTDHPINCVDWNQAGAFCRWIGGRLPTEEEREYVASGGSEGRTYPWGNEEPGARACWDGEGNDLGKGNRKTTCPIGSHKAGDSKWGLHDLAGNVWEWTSSDYDSSKKGIRGGSWYLDYPEILRAQSRNWVDPSGGRLNVGFRCGL